MHHRSAWRLLAGPAAAAAAALALTTPAFAAAAATLDISLADITVGVGAETRIDPVLSADRTVTVTGAAITYQLSGVDGVSLVRPEFGDCTLTSPTELTCTDPFELELGPDGTAGSFEAGLKAAGSAVAGATGTLKATFSADGAEPVSTTAQVKVAEAVDLTAGRSTEISVKPGAAFNAELTVTNTGTKVVRGAGVLFYTDYAFETTKRFKNCVYRDDKASGCLFEGNLAPGATYQVTLPYRLRKDTAAPGSDAGEFQWLTAGDYAAQRPAGGNRAGTAGTGPELRLQPVAKAKAAPQTDTDPDDNWQSLTVNAKGKQGSDVAAVGAKVSGAAGATVQATVGLRNNGPATIDSSRSGEPASMAVVTVPSGTTVVTVPAGCSLAEDDSVRTNPKAVQYACYAGFVFRAGTTVGWKFGLRIDKVVADAKGAVEANPPCQCSRFSGDLKKSNDKALLVVNPTDAEPGTGGGDAGDGDGAASGGEDGGTGGGEPGLPITGPQGAAFAGAGALLVAAGVAGFLIARKRRTRFEV